MPGTPLFDEYKYEVVIPRDKYECWDMAHVVFKPINMKTRWYYYHIVRAYIKTSANKKQRKFNFFIEISGVLKETFSRKDAKNAKDNFQLSIMNYAL